MEALGAEAMIVYGNRGEHSDLLWLCGFPASREAALLLPLHGEPVLFVNYFNHLPTAIERAWLEDVRWGEDNAVATAAREAVQRRYARVATAGPIGGHRRALDDVAATVDAATPMYDLRIVRSPEELDVIRRAAELSDAAVTALREQAVAGMTDFDLLALVEAQWTPRGARTGIAYIGVNRAVPAQLPSGMTVASGDVVTVELSANVAGYWGQVLRTFRVGGGALPEPEAALLEVAVRGYEEVLGALRAGARAADLEAAGAVLDAAGCAIIDDLAHIGGGGAYAPYVRTPATAHRPPPDFTYLAGMCVVVQPNPVTPDLRTGVQHGELLLVTEAGTQRLHSID